MKALPLFPRKSYEARKLPEFGVCDIEASEWVKFLVIGYFTVFTDKPILKYFEKLMDFCDWVFTDEQPHSDIYAHFGGKYDFSFILEKYVAHFDKYHVSDIVPRGSGILCFEVSTFDVVEGNAGQYKKSFICYESEGRVKIKKRSIKFRDSSAMLPFSLASITENFGVEHPKQKIDYEKIVSVTPELLKYLEFDLKGLYESLIKYFSWPFIRKAGFSSTVASQAMKCFQTKLDYKIPSLSGEDEIFVRQSYMGGRTEIFKPFFQQTEDNEVLRTYDVNSLYPTVMRNFEYPVKKLWETNKFDDSRMGFYNVTVEVPEMYIPPLGTFVGQGVKQRYMFPFGAFRGNWTSDELKYAMSQGVKIKKVHKGLLFVNGGPIFKDYINELYEIRKQSKKASVDNVLCKLLMNSTYGRFGLNRFRDLIEFEEGQHNPEVFADIELGRGIVSEREVIRIRRLVKREIYLGSSFANVAIASWVTSQARIHMHKLLMQDPESMYYMDTDSMFTTHAFLQNDDDLGALKKEYTSTDACFILPKTYRVETTDPIYKMYSEEGKEIDEFTNVKIVMKGFDKKIRGKFKREDFLACLEGEMSRLRAINPPKFATLKTAAKHFKFLKLLDSSERQIRSHYNKRRIVKRDWKHVYDTEPLEIKNGKILNAKD
jgi:DNA polymerase type B, organellar and viral